MNVLSLGTCAFGRSIGARGEAIDGGPALEGPRVRVETPLPSPAQRAAIVHPFWTGIRAIDGLLAIGRGARIGIFGAPGTGKSVLLESIVAGAEADAVVVGLIGERGREAQRWIEACDGRTTIVCATSDRPAAERAAAACVAAAQARALCARGLHVLLVLDSLARVAAARREIDLAAGASVGRGGYPPSVFADLAKLVEAAGAWQCGSITLIATVLSDGDERDPVSEAARSLLDGHLQLCTRLANAGRFPAIDVPASASRTMAQVVAGGHRASAATVRRALAWLERTADARDLGIELSDPLGLRAIAAEKALEAFLHQGSEPAPPAQTLAVLAELADMMDEPHGY